MPSVQNQKMKGEALQSALINTKNTLYVYKFDDVTNHGWMGACNIGIKESGDMDYVVLANDDILVPGLCDWAEVMVDIMEKNTNVGALSCITNNAAGYAKLSFDNCTKKTPIEVPWTPFFFVMLRNEAIKKVGLFDEELPGADDLDYCIRLRDAGYKVAVTPQVFVWHYYGQTGGKVYGDWDREDYTEMLHRELIKKHGFKKYCWSNYLT